MKKQLFLVLTLGVAATAGAQVERKYPKPTENVEIKTGAYEPTWESTAQWECPEWYMDAKFGIWAHWDPQCVPAYGDWYARGMYFKNGGEWSHHCRLYGDPCVKNTEHGYKELCRDWKAEKWDPEYLIGLYHEMGAKYFCAMGQHHDNFDCWDSPYQPWNSTHIGPERDVVGDWNEALKKYDMPLMVSMHGAHAWLFYEIARQYDGGMTLEDGKGKWWEGYDPYDLYAQNQYGTHPYSSGWENSGNIHSQWNWGNGATIPSDDFTQTFQNRVLQCVNKYHPKMLYFDDTVLPFYGCKDQVGLNILAHCYNTDPEMVITGKVLNETHKQSMLWDIERGIPDRPQEKYWQTCTCIGGWHYGDTRYKDAQTVINMLVDIVAKNGNLLLSIPVKGNGEIDDAEKRIVADITAWMKQNQRSIHGTRVWKSFGEGPIADASNPLNNQGFNEGQYYSNKEVRYVVKHAKTDADRDTVFATIMRWPDARTFTFKHLGRASEYYGGEVESIELLGHGAVAYTLSMDGLTVQLPAERCNAHAPVFAFTFKAGTDKPLTLVELVDYCKSLTANATESNMPVNTGSPNNAALDDLAYAVSLVEPYVGGSEEEQATAMAALRKAYNIYTSQSVAQPGAPLYTGTDLTKEQLVQASGFSRTSKTANGKRFGEPKNWTVTNFNIPNGNDGVKQGIDSYNGTAALMLGVWDDRQNAPADCDLSQAAIRRTVHLTPGTYYFGATFNACYQLGDDAYMYAASEAELRTADIPAQAIAWAHLNAAPKDNSTWWGITFIVTEEQDVTLGFQADLASGSATQEFRATKVKLLRYDLSQVGKAKDVTLRLLEERDGFSRLDPNVTTRFATPKYWTVENFKIPNGNDGIKNGIDSYPGYSTLMLGVWNDASKNEEGSLANARIYRKLHLSPGTYSFEAQYNTTYSISARAFMFASTELYATTDIKTNALASIPINKAGEDDGKWYGITFELTEPQDVYVGWQAALNNGSATQEFRVKTVRMTFEPFATPDAVTQPKAQAAATKGGSIYDLGGRRMTKATHRGIFIEDGRKVLK